MTRNTPLEFGDDDTVIVDGSVNIHEVNGTLDIVLPEGEEFDYDTVTLRAEQVDETRIQKVCVTVDRDTPDPVAGELPAGEVETD